MAREREARHGLTTGQLAGSAGTIIAKIRAALEVYFTERTRHPHPQARGAGNIVQARARAPVLDMPDHATLFPKPAERATS
jgi:hypothetical protein